MGGRWWDNNEKTKEQKLPRIVKKYNKSILVSRASEPGGSSVGTDNQNSGAKWEGKITKWKGGEREG